MEYGFKVTTNGRELLSTCAATGEGLALSRVAMGSGTVPEGVDLADVHELYHYVTDGAISQRSHENDRLYLSVQYANSMNTGLPTYTIAEFMVYAIHPQTGEETDVIYGTLGSYTQPVPAYDPSVPVSVFTFPMVLIISDDIEVTVTAQAGLVTYDDLQEAVAEATGSVRGIIKSVAFTAAPSSWTQEADPASEYAYCYDIEDDGITGSMIPEVVLSDASLDESYACRMCATARSYAGYVRLRAKKPPENEISGVCYLSGKGSGGGGGGGDEYELPTATGTRLGGVKIGTGINVASDGTISVDHQTVMTDEDLLDEDATEEDLRQILTGETGD